MSVRLVLLTLFFVPCLASNLNYSKFSYYSFKLDLDNKTARTAQAKAYATALKAHFIGQIGELPNYFLIAIPKQSLNESRLVKRASSLIHLNSVERQVPATRLVRRGIIPKEKQAKTIKHSLKKPISIFDNTRIQEDINDPGFSKQWHLVIAVD